MKDFDYRGRWEWVTLALILGCYAVWITSTLGFSWVEEQLGLFFACLLLVTVTALAAAFHTSLQHEVVHGHPTPYAWLNEALVFPSLILVYPYRRYRDLHLTHHVDENLTDPYDDPESYYWPYCERNQMGRITGALLSMNNTFFGRMILGPPLGLFGFYRNELKKIVDDEPGIRLAWLMHAFSCLLVLFWVAYVCAIPVWIYVLLVAYPGVSWILIRSFAEHQASESVGGRTAIIESSWFFSLLFLNNNLHMVHHAHPGIAWYDIPKLYRQRKGVYLAANHNYFFKGYRSVVRNFAFRKKQPVFHPLLRREQKQQIREQHSQ